MSGEGQALYVRLVEHAELAARRRTLPVRCGGTATGETVRCACDRADCVHPAGEPCPALPWPWLDDDERRRRLGMLRGTRPQSLALRTRDATMEPVGTSGR